MMNVVTALPPSDGQTAAKVGDEHSDECVHDKDVRDCPMASIVGCKHDLMLWKCIVSNGPQKHGE